MKSVKVDTVSLSDTINSLEKEIVNFEDNELNLFSKILSLKNIWNDGYSTSFYEKMEEELDSITQEELTKIEVDKELEDAITELNTLKNQFSQKDSATLLELCKDNVIETITSQFGLASLFIISLSFIFFPPLLFVRTVELFPFWK